MKKTLNELLTEKSVVCRTENRIGIANCYRSLLHYVEKCYGVVQMSDVTPKWAVSLHKSLKADGKTNATIKNYFAMLQCITNYGAYIGCTKGDIKLVRTRSYELDKVKLEKPKNRQNKWLNVDDMNKLWSYWVTTDNKTHKKWLGIGLASYLCNGANLADVLRLRYDDEYYSSNKQLLGFYRQKTKNSSGAYVRIPIIDKLRCVIDTIGDGERKGGLLFGSFLGDIDVNDDGVVAKKVMTTNTSCSKVLRTIAKKIGIREDISVTFFRHSYISHLHHIGAPYSLVERNVGHSLEGVADSYIGQYDTDILFKWNNMLL